MFRRFTYFGLCFGAILLYPLLLSNTANQHNLALPIDDWIPFLAIMVIPYLLYLPLVALTIIYLVGFRDIYRRFTWSFVIIQVLASLVYLVYQTQMIRQTNLGDDIFSNLVKLVYTIDRPLNCFPSLHVANSVICYMYLRTAIGQAWESPLLLLIILIVASTVLIKQHYFVDILGGLGLSLGVYTIVQSEWLKSWFSGDSNLINNHHS